MTPTDKYWAFISYSQPGVRAGDAATPLLSLVNTALGGSFSSRLNQNLREDHHWTYGASSSFAEISAVLAPACATVMSWSDRLPTSITGRSRIITAGIS